MQLSNMDVSDEGNFLTIPDHLKEVLFAHGLSSASIPLFLKSLALYFSANPKGANKNTEADTLRSHLPKWIASFFELAETWVLEKSDPITPRVDPMHSQHNLLQFLIAAKQKGWKPKLVFVRSEHRNDNGLDTSENTTLLLIELLKITQTGIAVTTYKHWEPKIWQFAFLVGRAAGLAVRGVYIEDQLYQDLADQRILPVSALKNEKGLWFPEKNINESIARKFEDKIEIADLIQELAHIALQPTQLL